LLPAVNLQPYTYTWQVQGWAAQAFPHHSLIEVGSTAKASSIQAAIKAAQPAAALLVVIRTSAHQISATSSYKASHLLLVDRAIDVAGVDSLVLASTAALQQAAAAAGGGALPGALQDLPLLAVDCRASKDGAFLMVRWETQGSSSSISSRWCHCGCLVAINLGCGLMPFCGMPPWHHSYRQRDLQQHTLFVLTWPSECASRAFL
jgi:hypothetical protein